MQAVNEAGNQQAGEDARELECLRVSLAAGEFNFSRNVYPVGNATVAEIVAAMKVDEDFLNPLVEAGELEVEQDGKHILLARFDRDEWDSWEAEILSVSTCYDDGTSEELPE